MAQVFFPSANTISRVSLMALPIVVLVTIGAVREFVGSQFVTQVNYAIDQPVEFSHEHHVTGLGIDCRYCHTSVEESPFAGIPPTETCMTCHSQIWTEAPMLEPVRSSWRTGEPMRWNRVHDVPDFAFFDHSIHVAKGIGCVSCHGQVDQMPLTWKSQTLFMQWCLDCHRNPYPHVRPRNAVFDMNWTPDADPATQAAIEAAHESVRVQGLTNCSACHR